MEEDVKLTLKLKRQAIDEAKEYARLANTSLSKLTEKYYKSLVSHKKSKRPSGVVGELAGLIKGADTADYKEEYREYKRKKYL